MATVREEPVHAMPSPVRLPAGLAGPLVMGGAFYAAAAAALALTSGANGIAAFWPANGLLLAALLIAPRRHAWRYIAAAAVASVAANLATASTFLEALGYTAANIAEALLAWRLAFGRDRTLPSFVAIPQVARFFLAAWSAALASATLATLFHLSDALDTWSSWVTTDLLGLLIVTPMVVTAFAFARGRRALGEAALLLAGVAAIATIAFSQTVFPVLFLPVVALLLATLRLGPFGAAASVAIIALVGSAFTYMGTGPLAQHLHHGFSTLRLLYFQFYLLVLLGTGLPLAAVLAGRDRLVRRLAESNRLLRLAERSAGVGHWWIGMETPGVYCSPEVARIHGLAEAEEPTADQLLASYHRDDRARVAALLTAAIRDGTAFEFEARLVVGGEERRVHSAGGADHAANGTLLGVFGTLQDVTRRTEDQQALEAARVAAEQAARLATAAAETDALTGVANRRKMVALLDEAIDAATREGHPLSVAMLDLDHFKRVNDRFGHLVGDRVLTDVARIVAASLRGADVVGRMGGEEFILLLPTAAADQAAAIAERVRLAIAATGGGEDRPSVTASLGVATLRPGEEAAALLHRADCALYEAKRAGRNQLRLAA